MTRPPAAGERAALRGYRWQYDHVAALVYDAIVEDNFESLRLADPEASQVDDLVLLRRDRVDGFQFKSAENKGYTTLGQLTAERRSRSGRPAPSLLRSLADGWLVLRARWPNTRVHLVTSLLASPHDHVTTKASPTRPTNDSTDAFLRDVLGALHAGALRLDDVPTEWTEPVERVRHNSGLPAVLFADFVTSLDLDLGAPSPLPGARSTRRSDIIDLSNALYRVVSSARGVVQLDRRQLLDLMGWADRPRLRSHHDFPVDLDTYAPLEGALAELDAHLRTRDRGYVAVLGPPGGGKSTLLSQALSGHPDRVVRYYAYVPGYAPARTRMTARGFLHDLVLMLRREGLGTSEPHLMTEDREQLRRELHEQFDAAAREFGSTGRRTILVIDGLDHVEREHPGQDGLLVELPTPAELPAGVLVVVGTRTTSPLRPQARQYIEEQGTAVDLEHHRLPPAAIFEVCRRTPITATLDDAVHRRLVQLSGGHPLALTYLLNRLRDRDRDEDAARLLAHAPTYEGDIAAEYRAVWDRVEADSDLVAILAVCARLRVGFTGRWLETWAPRPAVETFRRELRYLFRGYHDGWRFFHDSFRQFAIHRTSLGDDGDYDGTRDADEHRRVADVCASTSEQRIADEELYHRHYAEQPDNVLGLASQERFRGQYRRFRPPNAIREDLALALRAVGVRGNGRHLLSVLLASIELAERMNALERIDLPGALLDAGLVDEALAVCGGDVDRQVPLAHAYRLAARLGRAGRVEGRRIFDLVDHLGFEDPERAVVSGEEDAAAEAWAEAAVLFRPLQKVLAVVQAQLRRPVDDHERHWERDRRRQRFAGVVGAVVAALAKQRRGQDLESVDRVLVDIAIAITTEGRPTDDNEARADLADLAKIRDLRFEVRQALVDLAAATTEAEAHLAAVVALVSDGPVFHDTLLDTAELLVQYGWCDAAATALARHPMPSVLTASALSYGGEPEAVERTFRYWRLRHQLTPSGDIADEPTAPSGDTPAGDDVDPAAAAHRDRDAIDLAARIDAAVRILARLDAATYRETPPPTAEAWRELVPLLDVFRPAASRSSATLGGIRQQKTPLMRLLVCVAARLGHGLPDQLVAALATRFDDRPSLWPTELRLVLARDLREAGVAVPWYTDVLAAAEAEAHAGDVTARLEEIAGLVAVHADDGRPDEARRLALTLIPLAFGVGYRKDVQFTWWTEWLGRALGDESDAIDIDEAVWLARLLIAVEPMTEGAPRSAAERLPAAVARTSPVAAVRIFEYLVRSGVVDHMKTLAPLLAALIDVAAPSEHELALAADVVAELIAPAANEAYPEAATAIIRAAQRCLPDAETDRLVHSIADRTDRNALPTVRPDWRAGLGLAASASPRKREHSSDDEYGSLVLSDGRRIPRRDVPAAARTASAVVELRRAESPESTFDWAAVVDALTLSDTEVRALAEAFADGSRRAGKVLVTLAEGAHSKDDVALARQLARQALASAHEDSWSTWYHGNTRRRAHAVAIASGIDGARAHACRDLAAQIMGSPWFAGTLTADLDEIVNGLFPDTAASETWPVVRAHLEGMAEMLSLSTDDVLDSRPVRWWLFHPHDQQRAAPGDDTPAAALAELAVAHLTHPTWVARDAATRIVIRALLVGDSATSAALARLAVPCVPDDVLEALGRCAAAARQSAGHAVPGSLAGLEATLAPHPSQVLRDLAETLVSTPRALSPVYGLTLPPTPGRQLIGHEPPFLAPHELQYRIVADGLDLDEDTMRAVAGRYVNDLQEALPDPAAVRAALGATTMQHTYPTPRISAARGAFGRVVADLTDAGLLDTVPRHIAEVLRFVDLDLLDRAPEARPAVVPPPPPAGHDQTAKRWLDAVDQRAGEYQAHATTQESWVVGATSHMTVLNWDHPEEELVCGSVLANNAGDSGEEVDPESLFQKRIARTLRDLTATCRGVELAPGEPLVMKNRGWTFHQPEADWLSFRPDVASALAWTPDPTRPGRWLTAAGAVAVDTIRWVDGWPGRSGPAFDDTEADGYAVVMAGVGVAELTEKFGRVERHFVLTRWARHDGTETPRVRATITDSSPLACDSDRP